AARTNISPGAPCSTPTSRAPHAFGISWYRPGGSPTCRQARRSQPTPLLHHRTRRRLVARRLEDPRRIDAVEAVLPAAEVAADLDAATLGQDALGFLLPQAAEHAGHALAAAGACEMRPLESRLRFEAQQLLVPEEPMQD